MKHTGDIQVTRDAVWMIANNKLYKSVPPWNDGMVGKKACGRKSKMIRWELLKYDLQSTLVKEQLPELKPEMYFDDITRLHIYPRCVLQFETYVEKCMYMKSFAVFLSKFPANIWGYSSAWILLVQMTMF